MNLEESNEIYEKNKQNNAKKVFIIGGIIFCIICIVLCFIIIGFLNIAEKNRFKTFLNGKEISGTSSNFYKKDENENYFINLKELARYVGYSYKSGSYEESKEDENSCYIENNYEIVSFNVNNKSFNKYIKESEKTEENTNIQTEKDINYIVKSEMNEKQSFTLEENIKSIDGQIYIPLSIVDVACNAKIKIDEKSLDIKSMDYLYLYWKNNIGNLGYSDISLNYENVRALAKDLIVVKNADSYGILSGKDGQEIISCKYEDFVYVQNENRFFAYMDSKVGIVSADGKTIISPKEYDNIETFDSDKKLYIVKKFDKYGIIDNNGNTILHSDYDAIGIKNISEFKNNDLNSSNILYNYIIPIKKGSKYGLYNLNDKKEISEIKYSGFGYITKSTDVDAEESALLIDKSTGIEGIVLNEIVKDGNNEKTLYGIYDANIRKEIIPCLCTRIYSKTNNGVKTYYMEFDGNQLEMREYFTTHGMITIE